MMDKKIRLNLGCGCVYKPGYINIDRLDNGVVDEVCDVASLPFRSDCVDLIEASKLSEEKSGKT